MAVVSGDFDITMAELRIVTRYVAESAEVAYPVFERAQPADPRPRAAIDAAWEFITGAPRTKRQRVASLDAHRAATEAPTEAARLAARAAGDAASAAYLHPILKEHQVGHILRAAACVVRIAELGSPDDPTIITEELEVARRRATPTLIDVLARYPVPAAGKNRVDQLMSALDSLLRASR